MNVYYFSQWYNYNIGSDFPHLLNVMITSEQKWLYFGNNNNKNKFSYNFIIINGVHFILYGLYHE